MGRVCVVPGCISGTVKDKRRREADQVRKCTLFQVPKDLQHRKVWSDELGVELTNNDVICELHFKYDDLNINDDYTLINGEVIVSVREKNTLKKTALPAKNGVDYIKRMAQENEFRLNIARRYSGKMPQAVQEKLKPIDVSTSTVELSNSTELQDVQMKELESLDTNTDNSRKTRANIENIFDIDMDNDDYHDNSNQSNVTDTNSALRNLVETLKQSHPRPNWAWGEKDDSIFFTLFDLNAFAVRCHVQVDTDMKVTIFLCDKEKLVNFTGITEITSIEVLTELLERLEKQKLCLGTGLSKKSRSETCAMSTKGSDICFFCTKEKTKLENSMASAENKYQTSSKDHYLLKKKYSYCSKKLDEARKRVAELEKEIINLEENYQKKILERLPAIQQDIVTMFTKFADLEKNRIRYSNEWINESLEIYEKSRPLYVHMRKRGILPLPCPQTLKAQKSLIVANSLQIQDNNLDGHEERLQSLVDSSVLDLINSEPS